MKRKEKGVFTITVKGDLFNKKYNYVIVQNNIQKEITDPYGYAVDANSEHSVVLISRADALVVLRTKQPRAVNTTFG